MTTHDRFRLPILLYDDECPLCLRFKQAMERLPGHESINKISIHDQEIYQVLNQVTYEQCQQSVHFIEVNGEIFRGVEAVQKLMHHLPAVKEFGWLAESEMGKRAVNYFYDMAEHYRKKLQNRCPSCKKDHSL
ncbi:MAG: DUF393 domain-containing protein [Bdellovibrio sp.]|nr:DUF393 domain-containing protein [Bdellovibrio sp.]